jgi:hypothetical protein
MEEEEGSMAAAVTAEGVTGNSNQSRRGQLPIQRRKPCEESI